MALQNQLIRLGEVGGVVLEVVVDTNDPMMASSRGQVWHVREHFSVMSEFLKGVLAPFADTWKELSKEVELSEASVKLSLGATAAGTFFIARGEGSANFEVEIKFTPKVKA